MLVSIVLLTLALYSWYKLRQPALPGIGESCLWLLGAAIDVTLICLLIA